MHLFSFLILDKILIGENIHQKDNCVSKRFSGLHNEAVQLNREGGNGIHLWTEEKENLLLRNSLLKYKLVNFSTFEATK